MFKVRLCRVESDGFQKFSNSSHMLLKTGMSASSPDALRQILPAGSLPCRSGSFLWIEAHHWASVSQKSRLWIALILLHSAKIFRRRRWDAGKFQCILPEGLRILSDRALHHICAFAAAHFDTVESRTGPLTEFSSRLSWQDIANTSRSAE
jgi:hypothetical protein